MLSLWSHNRCFGFFVFLSFIKDCLHQQCLAGDCGANGSFAKDEVGGGDGGEDGSGGDTVCSSGLGEHESASSSECRGDPGREDREDRLRRGGDQADSQSASDQALDECMFTKYEVILEGTNMLEKTKR